MKLGFGLYFVAVACLFALLRHGFGVVSQCQEEFCLKLGNNKSARMLFMTDLWKLVLKLNGSGTRLKTVMCFRA